MKEYYYGTSIHNITKQTTCGIIILLNLRDKRGIGMSKTELFEYDAVPSWGGFIYQGYVAIYVALKYILDGSVREEDMSNYELRLETLEDVSVVYKMDDYIEYLSIHQVKSKKDKTLSSYMKALKQLMYEKAVVKLETKEVQAYLHVRKNISDINNGDISEKMKHVERKVKQAYRIIKKYAEREKEGKLTSISKKRLLRIIKKDYFSINRNNYITARDEVIKCLKNDLSVAIQNNDAEEVAKIEQEIQQEMKDHEVAFIGDRKITWKWQSRTTLDSKRLKKDYPDIVKDYMKTTETRVFKVN